VTADFPPLDAVTIRSVLEDLSEKLRSAGSYNHHMMIAGGAALALRWHDRATHDVDVLDHRRRWQYQSGDRHTPAVDFISMRFPKVLTRAAAEAGETYGLNPNWLNAAVGIFTPLCDLDGEVVYRSDTLTVETPSAAVLLAMKLHAGRAKDVDDAALLIAETGHDDLATLCTLVADAYGPAAVTAETEDFATLSLHRAAQLAAVVARHAPGRTGDTTPWGDAGSAAEIADGVTYYTTAAHAGMRLSAERWAQLPPRVAAAFYTAGWAEKDCEVPLVVALLDLDPLPHFAETRAQFADRARSVALNNERYARALDHLPPPTRTPPHTAINTATHH
jgi:hypothetical protein